MFPIVSLVVMVPSKSAVPAQAQERFSFFQASTPERVERMLTLAGLRDNDVVVDLGSGDGLIPLTAARMTPRLRVYGVDIDAKLVDGPGAKGSPTGSASSTGMRSTPIFARRPSSRCGCFRSSCAHHS
jgi:hypothetical protein